MAQFDGDLAPNTTYNGSQSLIDTLLYNGSSVQFQHLVAITEVQTGAAVTFHDNRGHTLIGIEDVQTSDLNDIVKLGYSLAAQTGVASYGSREFWLKIELGAGNDTLTITDDVTTTFPAVNPMGALVLAGAGNDIVSGGKLDDQFDGSTGNDTIRGNGGNDLINGGDGADTLLGGAGNDSIIADGFGATGAADRITGGAGRDSITLTHDLSADRILYTALADSTVAAHDSINGFEGGRDKADLSAIDANSKLAGNQAFKLVANFTGHAGELQYDIINPGTPFDRWSFTADVNGDSKPDFEIDLIHPQIIAGFGTASWFVL